MEPYSFSFLRYYHEPLSGEFANVGVVLWAPKSRYLGFLATDRYARLNAFFGGFEHSDYRNMIGRISTAFEHLSISLYEENSLPLEKRPETAREIATRIIPDDSAALQWSKSRGGLSESPQQELQSLFQRHIQSHYEDHMSSRRDAQAVFRQTFEKAFKKPVISNHLRKHLVKTSKTEHKFPLAWKNGTWNVYETISFDMANPDQIRNKAHRWESLTRFLSQAEELKITYLLGRPSESVHTSPLPPQLRAYDAAKDILGDSSAILIEEDEAEDFAEDLESRIRSTTLDSI